MVQPNRGQFRESRMNLAALMLLIAGAGLGLWLVLNDLKEMLFLSGPGNTDPSWSKWDPPVLALIVFTVGGMSLVGVPLLLWACTGLYMISLYYKSDIGSNFGLK